MPQELLLCLCKDVIVKLIKLYFVKVHRIIDFSHLSSLNNKNYKKKGKNLHYVDGGASAVHSENSRSNIPVSKTFINYTNISILQYTLINRNYNDIPAIIHISIPYSMTMRTLLYSPKLIYCLQSLIHSRNCIRKRWMREGEDRILVGDRHHVQWTNSLVFDLSSFHPLSRQPISGSNFIGLIYRPSKSRCT